MLRRLLMVLAVGALSLSLSVESGFAAPRGHGHFGGYHGGHRGWGWGGFAAGAILGGLLAAPYYYGPGYYGPGYYYGAPPGDATAYCMQRFRSYDPASGTYLGYDGLRHPCP